MLNTVLIKTRLLIVVVLFLLISACMRQVRPNHIFILPETYEGIVEICDCEDSVSIERRHKGDSLIYDLRSHDKFCNSQFYDYKTLPERDLHFYFVTEQDEWVPITVTYLKWRELESKSNRDRIMVAMFYSRRTRDCIKFFIGKGRNIEKLVISSFD